MAAENALMRPLRSDSLKPRPSTQAVWEPPAAQASVPPEPQSSIPNPQPEPALAPEPEVFAAPEPFSQPVDPAPPEPLSQPEDPAPPEPLPGEPAQEPACPPPYEEAVFTFAPAVRQAAPIQEPPPPEAARPDPPPETEAEEEEEPFDLDAVIASILADGGEDDEDEDLPAAQDALPTEEMPQPAAVPLYDAAAPVRRPRRRTWIWLTAAALIVAAAGFAARRMGWLS